MYSLWPEHEFGSDDTCLEACEVALSASRSWLCPRGTVWPGKTWGLRGALRFRSAFLDPILPRKSDERRAGWTRAHERHKQPFTQARSPIFASWCWTHPDNDSNPEWVPSISADSYTRRADSSPEGGQTACSRACILQDLELQRPDEVRWNCGRCLRAAVALLGAKHSGDVRRPQHVVW